MALQVRGLTKRFKTASNTVTALEDISFTAADGAFIAVRGPSGCGKTTLLLILGTLLRPCTGKVIIDGLSPYDMSLETRSRFRAENIGFVFQEFYLIPYLSVLDNIAAPSLAKPAARARERAQTLIQRFHLTERAGHVPGMLSTGERQRVALARALFHEPKLLLADEPTGNLDAENAERVLSQLAEFAEDGGTVVMVTHSAEAANYAHGVLEIEAGRLMVAGCPTD